MCPHGSGVVFIMLAQLIPSTGGAPITLKNPITLIGRSSKLCDLVVDHTSVSKMHCLLVKTDGLIYMRDLGSTNGTRVNGQRVVRGALLPGDKLAFSSISYKVHLGPDPAASVAADGATEMIPIVTENGDAGFVDNRVPGATGLRKARSVGDSDLLPAD
jgi:pSer/pThr/pTyr-binding forkhead associated (FHA) protein